MTKALGLIFLCLSSLASVYSDCEFCKGCQGDGCASSPACDTGVCLYGCAVGYHGRDCSLKCPPRCTQCNSATKCTVCKKDRYGSSCQHKCSNCIQGLCSLDTGLCSIGCNPGYTGHPCKRGMTGKDDESTSDISSLSGLFEEQGYLLPVISCVSVFIVIIIIGIICKQRRAKRKASRESGDEKSQTKGGKKSKYYSEMSEIDDFAKSLKKKLLSDPDIKCLSVPGEKVPLELLRSRSGNCSMPFMDPIAEDLEEVEDDEDEDEDYEVESGPIKKVIFTIDPHEDYHSVLINNKSIRERILCVPDIVVSKCDDDTCALRSGQNGHVTFNIDCTGADYIEETNQLVPSVLREITTNINNNVDPETISNHLDSFLSSKSRSRNRDDVTCSTDKTSLLFDHCLNNNRHREQIIVS